MMRHLSLWLIGVFTFAFVTSAAHAQQVYGELKVVKGDVSIQSGRDSKLTKAAIGLRVFPSDTIKTGKDSRAKILMVDKNEINISPDSEIVLQKYVYDPAAGKKDVLLNVLSGKVRSKVEQKYDGKTTRFQVKTPSAVAGVRGTDFLTSFDSGTKQSQVVTFHGHVEFGQQGAGGAIQNPVMVNPGQMSTAAVGTAPTVPVEMPKQQLANMDKESKADTASSTPARGEPDSRQQNSNEKKKDDGAKNDGAKSDGAKNESAGNKDGGSKNDGNSSSGGSAPKSSSASGSSATGGSSDKSPGSATASSGSTPSMTGGDRNPASVSSGGLNPTTGPTPPPTSIIKPGDIIGSGGGCATCGPVIPAPINILPPIPAAPTTQPTANLPPPCDFCNSTIQNGNTKLLINVRTN